MSDENLVGGKVNVDKYMALLQSESDLKEKLQQLFLKMKKTEGEDKAEIARLQALLEEQKVGSADKSDSLKLSAELNSLKMELDTANSKLKNCRIAYDNLEEDAKNKDKKIKELKSELDKQAPVGKASLDTVATEKNTGKDDLTLISGVGPKLQEKMYKDRLLQLQTQKLLDEVKRTKKIQEIYSLLTNNQKKIDALLTDNQDVKDSASLVEILMNQVSDLQNEVTGLNRKLVAYREAAKKFKQDLDDAEERNKNFLEDIGMYEEYADIQSAVRLTAQNKASEIVEVDFTSISDSQKIQQLLTEELSFGASEATISVDILAHTEMAMEPHTITVFSEYDDYDDLSQIKGIGPKFEILLNNAGIYTFEQIANWTAEEIKIRDQELVFRGRIERDGWVEQAQQIIANQSLR